MESQKRKLESSNSTHPEKRAKVEGIAKDAEEKRNGVKVKVESSTGSNGKASNPVSSSLDSGHKKVKSSKVIESDESDDSSCDNDLPLGKLLEKKAEAKAVKMEEESDDEEDSSEDEPLIQKGKRSSKVKVEGSDNEEDDEEDDPDGDDDDDDNDDDDDDYSSEDDLPLAASARKGRRVSSSSSSSAKRSSKKKSKQPMCGGSEMFPASQYETREPVPLLSKGGVNRWWENLEEGSYKSNATKWKTLEHNGVIFPPPYEPHGVKMRYDGKPVDLTPEQEEVATFYAVLIESDHAEKKVFRDNFFKAWKKILGPGHVIKDFDKCDFRPIWKYSQEKKEEAKIYRKENREKLKKEKEELMEIYGYALVDGYREKIGNFRVEPPGLFRGRGQHPKTGRLKERVMPEQITLNIGKGAKIPKCPIEGHNWKGVIHNPNVTWLAFWKDNINGDFKYVWLDKSSKFKGQSDFLKYEKSRKLKDYIDKIRAFYNRGIKSNKTEDYELAVAIYLIDRLALRVGNEKGEDTADTVGCCSLRTAHIMFKCDESDPPITLEDTKIRLKFLGKDSIQYDNIVNVEAPFYKKLMLMKKQALKTVDRMRDKKEREKGANMFTKVDPSVVNTTLSSFMDGLTAKVFRTYNASITLQRELEKVDDEVSKETPIGDKVFVYNRSNRIVAELCNHQRAIPKSHSTQVGKMKEKMSDLLDKREALEEHIQVLKGKKKKKAKKEKKNKKGEKEPRKFSQNIDVCQRQLESCLKSITNLEARLKTKDETKAVSLGTSKINYMDPRITVAWCKRKELPLEKVFNASLVTKFPWAMDTKTDWKY